MDDPRNWGGGGRRRQAGDRDGGQREELEGRGESQENGWHEQRGGADVRGAYGAGGRAGGSNRRDPRAIGAPQKAPEDWGDFEWMPPRDLRPPSAAQAPREGAAAGAWKEFDTAYPEEPEPLAEPTPPDEEDWDTAAEAAATAQRGRTPAPRERERRWMAADEAGPDEWQWVAPPSAPAGGDERVREEADRVRLYGRAPAEGHAAAPTAGAPGAPQPEVPAAPRVAYRSYQSRGGPVGAGPTGPAGGGPGGAGPSGRGPNIPRPSGPMSGADRPDGRRLVPAGSILVALIIGLALAALLNAQSLQRQAESMHVGPARSLMLALVKPVVAVSSALRLDKPRAAIEDALGRGAQEQAGVHTRTPEPSPTSTPSDKPTSGGTKTPTAAPGMPATFSPTKDHKLALWVGGDSMAMVFGQSVVAMADGTGVIESALDYHVSSGLSRPDFFNWPNRIRAEMKSFQPDVAVFASGANDGQNVESEGQVLQYGSKPWLELYAKRVGAAMSLLGEKGKRSVWWVGMPIARDPDQSTIYRTLNKVYIEEAKKRPYVHYFDTYEMFSDKNGNYNDYLPGLSGKTELMRQGDVIHSSRAGRDLAAARRLEQISKVYPFEFEP